MNEFLGWRLDRRESPRTKLVEIAYIGMGPENGGLVLDVSEGGLSFHAVAPVERSQIIRFLLSLRGQSRVEGAGEVVWTNDARTVCGLKFTSLSTGAREHLNNWSNQSKTAASSPAVAAAAAADESAAPILAAAPPTYVPEVPEPDAPQMGQAPPEEESTEPAVSLESPRESESQPLFAVPPANQALWSNPDAKPQSGPGLFVWVLFVLLGAAIIVAAFLYGVHVGQSQVTAVVQRQTPPAPTTTSATAPPPAAPNDAAPSPDQNASDQPAAAAPSAENSLPNPAPSAAASAPPGPPKAPDASAEPTGSSASAPDQRTDQGADAGKLQFAAAMADLNGTNGQRNVPKAVAELWSAVGNGNSDAEIILAGLYADGFGVAKSCEQGRVLLLAAARSGNPKAKPKLDELNARGCK
jgi:hypothetical protein